MDENNLTYDKIVDVEISDKMKSAYIDYANECYCIKSFTRMSEMVLKAWFYIDEFCLI